MTLGEHLPMAASTSMFYFAIDYKNERNVKVAVGNINIKIISCFLADSWCPSDHIVSGKPRGT